MSETLEENHKRNYGACLDRERTHLLQLQQQAATIERLTQERDSRGRDLAVENGRLREFSTALQQQVRELREALEWMSRKRALTIFIEEEAHVANFFEKADAALASTAASVTEKEGGK